jgi:hypothetical protein
VFHCAEDATQRIYAVKGMLALHSPVLRSLLFGGMREAAAAREASVAVLCVPFGEAAVKGLVGFCQTGEVLVSRATVLDLLLIADYYQVHPLADALLALVLECRHAALPGSLFEPARRAPPLVPARGADSGDADMDDGDDEGDGDDEVDDDDDDDDDDDERIRSRRSDGNGASRRGGAAQQAAASEAAKRPLVDRDNVRQQL